MIQQGGIALLVGLVTTFLALGKWGIKTYPTENPSKVSPKNTAFGIWTPIFLLIIFKSINSIINNAAQEKFTTLLLLSLSFVCSALWVYFSSKLQYKSAAVAITLAGTFAFSGHFIEDNPENTVTWISQSSGAILASWLMLASVISWDYATPNLEFSPILPLIITVLISTISIYAEKPLFMIALLWASIFLKKYNVLAFLITSLLTFISFYSYFIE